MTSGAGPRGGSVAIPPRSVAGMETCCERGVSWAMAVDVALQEVLA